MRLPAVSVHWVPGLTTHELPPVVRRSQASPGAELAGEPLAGEPRNGELLAGEPPMLDAWAASMPTRAPPPATTMAVAVAAIAVIEVQEPENFISYLRGERR